MPRLKGIKFIEESMDELYDNYAWIYFDPKKRGEYENTAIRLSKKYPNQMFGIIDYGRMSRGWFPAIDVTIGGKLDNKEDDVQGHVSSFCVGVLEPNSNNTITGVGGQSKKHVTFYKNGNIYFPKDETEEYKMMKVGKGGN